MKSKLAIIKSINGKIMDLEAEETNHVLMLVNIFGDKDIKLTAKMIAVYLSHVLPVNVESDLIHDLIKK